MNIYQDVTVVEDDADDIDNDSPHHTRVLGVDWTSSGDPELHFNLGFPQFGLADQEASANGSTDFSVVLEDGDGTTQSHPISAFGDVRETFGGVSETDAEQGRRGAPGVRSPWAQLGAHPAGQPRVHRLT